MPILTTAIAVAGLGMSLWDKAKQSEADDLLKKQMIGQKGSMAQALSGVGQAREGELSLAQDRREEQTNIMTKNMSGDLKSKMSQIKDSGTSFSNSYRDTASVEGLEESMWRGYEEGKSGIDTTYDNQRISSFTNASGTSADMRKQMDELEAQINSLA